MPNFNSSLFGSLPDLGETDDSLDSHASTAFDTSAEDENIGPPMHASSAVASNNSKDPARHSYTPLRVLDVNAQSIVAKKEAFWLMLGATKPDVIMVTETWLNSDINQANSSHQPWGTRQQPGKIDMMARHMAESSSLVQ